MNRIESAYDFVCSQPSDINEHCPTLSMLASHCNSVAEFGVRSGVSTVAILHGLYQSSKYTGQTVSYVGVDIDDVLRTVQQELAHHYGINYSFLQHDSAKVQIDNVDMLFIDTFHVYGHLKRELANNCNKVRKYIVMHDTTVDGIYGEALRQGYNVQDCIIRTGYTYKEITTGLWPAVQEFLEDHPEWALKARYQNNNGLTVLERV